MLKLDAMEVSKKEGNVGLTGAAQGYSEVQAPVECYDMDVDAGSKLGISTQTAAVANATSLAVFRTHTEAERDNLRLPRCFNFTDLGGHGYSGFSTGILYIFQHQCAASSNNWLSDEADRFCYMILHNFDDKFVVFRINDVISGASPHYQTTDSRRHWCLSS